MDAPGKPSPRRGEVESASADRVRGRPSAGIVISQGSIPTRKASVARARTLRRSQTDPERLLWSRLRDRRLCSWKFRRQVPVGRFIVDFCCTDAKLVVELDGGGHTLPGAAARDRSRSRDIERAGYVVIRFWNAEVTQNLDGVCDTILAAIEKRG